MSAAMLPSAPLSRDHTEDLTALSWVHEELRRSLETAHKLLRRHLKEAALAGDAATGDPSLTRQAQQHLHQGVGALELIGLPSAALLLRASEAALAQLLRQRKLSAAAVDTLEFASFALLDYLHRLLGGKPVSPLLLFPQYRAVQELAGAERVHPADLWPLEWRWRELPADASAQPRPLDADARAEVELQTLALMRQPEGAAAQRLSDLFAGLGAGSRHLHVATLWKLAGAFFEAQGHRLLRTDMHTKRMASRLLAQLRAGERNPESLTQGEVVQRLAHDLLFFCAQSLDGATNAPRLAAVQAAWSLPAEPAVDYESSRLGRFDPAWVSQARKRVAVARDAWSAVAGGELHRLGGIGELFALVGESLRRLFPGGERLAAALHDAVAGTADSGQAPPAGLAMEVATSVLYVDAALEDADFDRPDEIERVQRLAERIAAARGGAAAQPLAPWMEALYRRVSDRQTMGSVVQELRAALGESEKQIDLFFRAPQATEPLVPVPGQLQAMRGVLSVLGFDQASQAVLRMRDDVDLLLQGGVAEAAQPPLFDRLAANLGMLGFLIDMLSVQPQVAKSLFAFDADSGLLRSTVGSGVAHRMAAPAVPEAEAAPMPDLVPEPLPTPAEPPAPVLPELPALPELSLDLPLDLAPDPVLDPLPVATAAPEPLPTVDAVDEAPLSLLLPELDPETTAAMPSVPEPAEAPLDLALPPLSAEPATPVAVATPAAPEPAAQEEDDELREVFLEEARDVLSGAAEALQGLAVQRDDIGRLTTLRRAFHTLKGSGRMVGLNDFGEAAWAAEQLYNARLAGAPHADDDLLGLTGELLDYLGDWVQAVADRRDGGHAPQPVQQAADAMRLQGLREPLFLPAAPGTGSLALAGEAPEDLSGPVPLIDAGGQSEYGALEGVLTEPLDRRPPWVLPVSAPAQAGPAEPPAADIADISDTPDTAALLAAVPDLPSADALDLDFGLDFGSPAPAPAADAAALPPAPQPLFEPLMTSPMPLLPVLADDPSAAADRPTAPEPEPQPEPRLEADAPLPEPEVSMLVDAWPDFHLGEAPAPAPLAPAPFDEPAPAPFDELAAAEPAAPELPPAPTPPDEFKHIGELQVPLALFNIFLAEADEQSRRLGIELAEWALELHRPVGETAVALAHSLAGNSATVGFGELSQLARLLEHALAHSQVLGQGDGPTSRLFNEASDEIRQLLHQFAAGFLRSPSASLVERLQACEQALAAAAAPMFQELPPDSGTGTLPGVLDSGLGGATALVPLTPAPPLEPPHATALALDDEDGIDAVDAVDAELWPIFEEEAQELLPQLAARLRDWAQQPEDPAGPAACMRTLHTLKGGARLAGAMRLGEMAHRLETAIEHLLARPSLQRSDVEALEARVDAINTTFEALQRGEPLSEALQAPAGTPEEAPQETPEEAPPPFLSLADEPADMPADPSGQDAWPPLDADLPPAAEATPVVADALPEAAPAPATAEPPPIDWSRFTDPALQPTPVPEAPLPVPVQQAPVRVRAALLDRLVNHAGEVSITRSRIDTELVTMKHSLGDLTENLERLRRQLRDLELQAETQISSRIEAAKASQTFDPLEMDRFTRFQELTRMMAESVNDVATVQRSLQRSLQTAEDEIAAQGRLTRDLQDGLLRTRMVEFEGIADRLYRVVRQASKETGKQVRLDIVGGAIEVDRGVLDRMTGAFEHLLRNGVVHGIEAAELRSQRGKDPVGRITISLSHAGNEVGVEVRDDGGGLDLLGLRERGVAQGLVAPQAQLSDAELAQLVFAPGLTTAAEVTELAGRGVGMDVVRSEVLAMGGRIETATSWGEGTSFRLVLPLTTAVTQVVMLRAGELTVAVPAPLVEAVRRVPADEVAAAYASSHYPVGEQLLPFFWLGGLLHGSARGSDASATQSLVVIRSAQQRVVLHVDDVVGNHEVVVKNLGAQLSRLPGLVGVTLLASGSPTLIYNPVALASLYGEGAQAAAREAQPAEGQAAPRQPVASAPQAPLVLVVDDSLTVRRVTQRLLQREGYRVVLAKDGLEGLEKLASERPVVLLTDIEMPRMDGFDLVRKLRSDDRLRTLPVVMITSRIAQKHRDVATELGVDHYLGKPYSEEQLLGLVAHYAAEQAARQAAGELTPAA
ncbi:Hpt domain-containing protein [Aquincola tertiaricarbonis]|uniref:histidine kinase n=1 Tax=Aquincola tertiaricarbonis TaxID=391953 RepID=A0ABY4S8M8_AQUTE|nr:Hpt domain-containing protein [Aquincola tertiaricarbonis]URI09349.1 Hpt domain-containing protein [Aquincola tertiaricarbonis]